MGLPSPSLRIALTRSSLAKEIYSALSLQCSAAYHPFLLLFSPECSIFVSNSSSALTVAIFVSYFHAGKNSQLHASCCQIISLLPDSELFLKCLLIFGKNIVSLRKIEARSDHKILFRGATTFDLLK